MNGVILITHPGKLGDMLYSLPVASWLYRRTGTKTHWVLPEMFGPFRYIANLLMAQPLTHGVTLCPHKIENFDCGGQPYAFDPRPYVAPELRDCHYFNFGFRGYPNKYIPEFYADEYALGIDPDFRLNLGPDPEPSGEILHTSEGALTRLQAMGIVPKEAVRLPAVMDLLELARKLKAAKEVHSWFCGIAVLCWLADIPATVYRVPGHGPLSLYFPEPRRLTFREVTL